MVTELWQFMKVRGFCVYAILVKLLVLKKILSPVLLNTNTACLDLFIIMGCSSISEIHDLRLMCSSMHAACGALFGRVVCQPDFHH